MKNEFVQLLPEVLLTGFCLLVCIGILWRSTLSLFQAFDRRITLGVFSLKLLAGFVLWVIYTSYFPYRDTSDSFRYFDDAMHLHGYLFEDPQVWIRFFFGWHVNAPDLDHVHEGLRSWQSAYRYGIANDNPTIVRINMLIRLVSGGVYAVHVVLMCFMALIGQMLLARALQKLAEQQSWVVSANALLVGATLFPTVLFWSSSVLKEVPLVLGLGLLLHGLWRVSENRKAWWWVLAASLLLLHIKSYVFICMLPALLGWLLYQRFALRPLFAFPLALTLCYGLALSAKWFFPAGGLLYILRKKQEDFYNVAAAHQAGSTVEISPVSEQPLGFLADLPERLTLTYLRPFPSEADTVLQWAASAENFVFLAGVLFMVVLFVRPLKNSFPWVGRLHQQGGFPLAFTWALISFGVAFAAVAGSTVPVLGALVRYKLPVLLFFGVLLFLLASGRQAAGSETRKP